MRLIVSIVFTLCSLIAYGQAKSTLPFRADTIRFYKQGGAAEFLLENATKDSTGGMLVNVGGGKTRFIRARRINDSQIVIGLDTLNVCACGSSGVLTITFITHPSDASISTGDPVTFYATVANWHANYEVRWYKNGVLALTQPNRNSQDISANFFPADGDQFYIIATNLSGDADTSNTATVTVVTVPVITYGYSTGDPYVDNSTVPTIGSPVNQTITHNADLSLPYTAAAVDHFLVIKEPSTEPVKTVWYSTATNNGTIGDAAFRAAFVIGAWRYYVTRDAAGLAFDPSVPIQLRQ